MIFNKNNQSTKRICTHVALSASLLSACVGDLALAHSGKTNAQGCHAGARPYHCHGTKQSKPRRPKSSTRDKNCSDFASWTEAQRFYEQSKPGDPHRLDADRDGIACEGLKQKNV